MIEQQNTIIVIPTRLASRNLPGRPLADIWGVPLVVHVWRRAMEAKIGHVLVAAADLPIAGTWTLEVTVRVDEFTEVSGSSPLTVR